MAACALARGLKPELSALPDRNFLLCRDRNNSAEQFCGYRRPADVIYSNAADRGDGCWGDRPRVVFPANDAVCQAAAALQTAFGEKSKSERTEKLCEAS